jgi:hypothetical protein
LGLDHPAHRARGPQAVAVQLDDAPDPLTVLLDGLAQRRGLLPRRQRQQRGEAGEVVDVRELLERRIVERRRRQVCQLTAPHEVELVQRPVSVPEPVRLQRVARLLVQLLHDVRDRPQGQRQQAAVVLRPVERR